MTRHVFPTSEIPHKWAHQTQNAARNPQGNLYFRGPTIYSYRVPGPTMLRVVGDEIVTSQGARVPLAAAPMVWNLVGRAMALGGYESAGFSKALRSAGRVHIGTYPLDRIDADGTLHAGCHTIPYSELASVARQLGLS